MPKNIDAYAKSVIWPEKQKPLLKVASHVKKEKKAIQEGYEVAERITSKIALSLFAGIAITIVLIPMALLIFA